MGAWMEWTTRTCIMDGLLNGWMDRQLGDVLWMDEYTSRRCSIMDGWMARQLEDVM